MEITLIRHGMTHGNTENRYSGSGTDEPLCAEGEAQARAAGARTDVTRIYVSPMTRTRQTASICYPFAEQVPVEDLREMHFGDFEDRTAEEMANDPAYTAWVNADCLTPCPNGESIPAFGNRVGDALTALILDSARRGEDRLTVVTHGGVIMALMHRYADSSRAYYSWFAPNCEGYRVWLDPDTWLSDPRFTAYEPACVCGACVPR